MNTKYIILLLGFFFAVVSCEKKHEIISENSELPSSVVLIKNNIDGEVDDNAIVGINNALIKIMYDKHVLGQTNADSKGEFILSDQPIHSENSYILFEKEGYSPNIYTKVLRPNETEFINPWLKKLLVNQGFSDQKLELKANNHIDVAIPAGLVTASNPILKMQFLDFSIDSKKNLLAYLAENGPIDIGKMLWIDIVDTEDKSLEWVDQQETAISFSKELSNQLPNEVWFFDTKTARWVQSITLLTANDYKQLKIKQSGFYAFGGPCANDFVKPVARVVSLSSAVVGKGQSTMLYAQDFDNGSTDNCATTLTYEAKIMTDICNNGSDAFGTTIVVCSDQHSQKLQVVFKVTDSNNNSDTAVIELTVWSPEIYCETETVNPIAKCVDIIDVAFSSTNGYFDASKFNSGSTDDCTSQAQLEYKVRKIQQNICPSGDTDFHSVLELCTGEINSTLDLELIVFDKRQNSDKCTFQINVKP